MSEGNISIKRSVRAVLIGLALGYALLPVVATEGSLRMREFGTPPAARANAVTRETGSTWKRFA